MGIPSVGVLRQHIGTFQTVTGSDASILTGPKRLYLIHICIGISFAASVFIQVVIVWMSHVEIR